MKRQPVSFRLNVQDLWQKSLFIELAMHLKIYPGRFNVQ